jgi:hypothetical protein
MESFVNEPFLKKRAMYAKWGSYVGLGALVLGLFTTTTYPLLAYLFMLVGLIGATFGSYMSSQYVREPRADKRLDKALEGLDKRYAAYHYYLTSNHVLTSHYGFIVLIPRGQEGEVSYQNGRWQHKGGFRKVLQLFGEPGLGKPDQDLTADMQDLKQWIDQVMPEANIPVSGAIVMTGSNVTLHTKDAPVPVVELDKLPDYLKTGLKGQTTLTTAMQKELRRVMDEVIAQANAPKPKKTKRNEQPPAA